MKYLLVIVSILVYGRSDAQAITSYASIYGNNAKASMSNLGWIKTVNDFQQSTLSVAEIEARIAALVKNAPDAYSVECPVNSKVLTYLGYIAPKDITEFNSTAFQANSITQVRQHVYKYDVFYIAVPEDKNIDGLNVFFTIRAINILKYRYPEAYARLVLETASPNYNKYVSWVLSGKPVTVPYLNANKLFFLSYNQTPVAIAAGFTAFNNTTFGWVKQPSVQLSYNYPMISFHNTNLRGVTPNFGSHGIYKLPTAYDNYDYYMRDGLVESLVHELLHRYIDAVYTVDPLSNYLFNNRNRNDNALIMLEETIVRYTAASYFEKSGGISPAMLSFEKTEADLNCADLLFANHLKGMLDTVSGLKDSSHRDSYFSRILRLPVW